MMKKSFALVFALIAILSLPLILAQSKISIEPIKESFKAGENITLKVSLFDEKNAPINQEVSLIFEDPEKKFRIERVVTSNEPVYIDLGNFSSRSWKITAFYKGEKESVQAATLIVIEENELASFELNGDVLTVANTGNIRYTKTIQILIGETVGAKEINLGVGESVSFRLVAPDGNYDIKIITDGVATLTRSNVALTGNVIGILDERLAQGSPITVGINPSERASSGLKNKTLIYVFIIAVFGAMILLAIERRYRRRLGR